MYSKFFLVFFSLFLLLLSGLAENFHKIANSKETLGGLNRCRIHLSPSMNPSATHFQLVREEVCTK